VQKVYIRITKSKKQVMKTTTERVRTIRNELKNVLPAYKFSITKKHWNGVRIVILSGPAKLTEENYEDVNTWYINEQPEGVKKNVLNIVNSIASEGVIYRETGDYGTQPDFYVTIKIGEFSKPYIHN
jgi:hypothetical protein